MSEQQSEWLKVMLGEIARKRNEAELARVEDARREDARREDARREDARRELARCEAGRSSPVGADSSRADV